MHCYAGGTVKRGNGVIVKCHISLIIDRWFLNQLTCITNKWEEWTEMLCIQHMNSETILFRTQTHRAKGKENKETKKRTYGKVLSRSREG